MITDKSCGGSGSSTFKTLRDEFAGLAMQSLIVCTSLDEDEQKISEIAYVIADAMIAERNK